MASEPMHMGSPYSSQVSHGSQPYLPAYLLGEPSSQQSSPTVNRLWPPGSPPKSHSLNKSFASPQVQNLHTSFIGHDSRVRDSISGRTKEKSSAPPVQGLLETVASPDKSISFLTPAGRTLHSNVSFSASHRQDASFANQSSSTLAHPSPAQVDPFYAQGEHLQADDELDPTWITVFGFPPAASSFVLQQFSQYGNILKHVMASDGNWMHIHYQSKLQAKKALSKHSKILNGIIMIGVTPCIDKAVMATYSDTSDNSRAMSQSMMTSSAPTVNDSVLQNSMNVSHNTSIRPLTAAYKAVSTENQVVRTLTPQKEAGVVSKAMHYMFGW